MNDRDKRIYLLGKFTYYIGAVLFFATLELVCLAHIFLK